MASRIKQLVVYTKVTIAILLLVGIVILIFKNWGYKTRFWPGAADVDVPTLWLMLATGVLSIIAYWILSKTRRAFADLAKLRDEQAEQRALAEQEQRSKALNEQEHRIDEKIKKALNGEDAGSGASPG